MDKALKIYELPYWQYKLLAHAWDDIKDDEEDLDWPDLRDFEFFSHSTLSEALKNHSDRKLFCSVIKDLLGKNDPDEVLGMTMRIKGVGSSLKYEL